LILPVVLIQMFGYGEDTVEQTAGTTTVKDQDKEKKNASMNNEETITAPLAGKVLTLSEVPDAVFSSGAMGKGFAIEPTDNKLYAPFDGSV
ncbi:PTS glucose transporter subunit IIA, partial [Streptococcus pneumoniae]|nr:PTS glucose transporter subunit IIA [Streptococcus pneumoniae]